MMENYVGKRKKPVLSVDFLDGTGDIKANDSKCIHDCWFIHELVNKHQLS